MGESSIEVTHGVRRPAALRLLSDDRLARRAAEGDRGAFAIVFERHHQGLYRYCRAILRHDEDARDALQTAFTRAITALDGDERTVAIKPWLYRIAHNEAITMLRRRRPHAPLDSQPEAASTALGPEDSVVASERMAQLREDLDQLPERQRSALLLRELNDLTYPEIAGAITTTEQAARQSVYEARVMLMELQQGREMPCADVQQLISARDGRLLRPRRVRAHLKACEPCSAFQTSISQRRSDFGVIAPPLPAAAAAALLSALLGGGGGGGWGGGGLLALIGAGKGIVAGAGTKGVATATALTIAGGALVTGNGTVPKPDRPEQSGPKRAGIEAAATPRSSSPAPAAPATTLSFAGHGAANSTAGESAPTAYFRTAAGPHERTPAGDHRPEASMPDGSTPIATLPGEHVPHPGEPSATPGTPPAGSGDHGSLGEQPGPAADEPRGAPAADGDAGSQEARGPQDEPGERALAAKSSPVPHWSEGRFAPLKAAVEAQREADARSRQESSECAGSDDGQKSKHDDPPPQTSRDDDRGESRARDEPAEGDARPKQDSDAANADADDGDQGDDGEDDDGQRRDKNDGDSGSEKSD